jgi:hypothetical protein
MAETAPQKNYSGHRKVTSPLSKKKKKRKATTGGTKHVVASEGGSL